MAARSWRDRLLCYFRGRSTARATFMVAALSLPRHRMIKKVVARKAGGSLTVALPAAVVDRMGLEPGQPLWAVEQLGGLLLTPYDPSFERTVDEYRRGATRYREALRVLDR